MEKRLFGTDGIRGKVGIEPITPQFALKLGYVIGHTLQTLHPLKDTPTVLVAKDTRYSGDNLESNLVSGLLASNVKVECLGILPTPGLAYLTHKHNAAAGIMITASHNPHTDNGFKYFSNEGTKLSDTMQKLIEKKLNQSFSVETLTPISKSFKNKSLKQNYLNFLKSTVFDNFSLKRKKIVLDCAFGATYEIAPQLFKELGAELIVLHDNPNGHNINLHCGSTQPSALQQCVLNTKADLGIAFDGDGDRLIMVDHTGAICDGDDLLFVLAKYQLKKGNLQNQTVVGTQMSNQGLALALSHLNIHFVRTPVGDRYVFDALQKTHSMLGGEPSGHIICKRYSPTADGLIAALQVLMAIDKTNLYKARQGFDKHFQYTASIPTENPEAILASQKIKDMLKKEQIKLQSLQGRLLVRASGTEPVIRIMIEAPSLVIVQEIGERLSQYFQTVIQHENNEANRLE